MTTRASFAAVQWDQDTQMPASPAQHRLWLASAADPSGVAYNICHAVRLTGRLNVEALSRAVARCVERHAALRTVFQRVDGMLYQVPLPASALPNLSVEIVDPAQREGLPRRIDDILREETHRRFDLGRGPLFSARALAVGDDEHVLIFSLHHIVCDAWSLEILARELAAWYDSVESGVEPRLTATLDSEEQRFAALTGDQAGDSVALEYWRRTLADVAPVLPWPADYVRPAEPTGNGGRVDRRLTAGTAAALRAYARRLETTPFVVTLSAFAGFLSRWTGADDIPIGTPVSGRARPGLESLIGPFMNTVVPRFRFDGTETLGAAVATGRQLMTEAIAHQSASIDAIVQTTRVARVPGVHPLFQVLCAWQRPFALTLRNIRSEPLQVPRHSAKADLTLFATEHDNAIDLSLEYNSDIFAGRTADAALRAFERLLISALAQPDRPLSQLRWLSPAERAGALESGRGVSRPCPIEALWTLFCQQARRTADAAAIDDGDGVITYRELQMRAQAVAGSLRQHGVMPGDAVALLMKPDRHLPAGVLGTVAAGAVYVPIDPAQPEYRTRAMLDDCRAAAVLVTAPVQFSIEDRPVVDIMRLRATDGACDSPAIASDAPACIMYTSGSTGTPKGVVVPHRAIVRLVVNADYLQVGQGDRVALISNPAFDASTFEIWSALLNGAALVPLPPDILAAPRDLVSEWRSRRVSVALLTTAVFNRVSAVAPDGFASMRAVLFGGEASDPSAVDRVLQAGPPERLLQVYGPTENTTFTTWHEVRRVDRRAATVPIGRPVASSSAFVLDANLEPIPDGVVGELYIGGDGLTLGYAGDPDRTRARFVDDPFEPGHRLYRSGDRCRVTPDGVFEFVGRVDRQVKLRGFRIELEEIEQALLQYPGVTEAAVDVVGSGEQRRLAAIVAGVPADRAAGVRSWLALRLPPYMVPASIRAAACIPLTRTGKLDRHALEAMQGAAVQAGGRQPRDPLEADLLALWEELLGVGRITIDDDFFALGGHSLLAAQMMERAEALFGRRLPLSALMGHPTVATLAEAFWRMTPAAPLTTIRESGSRVPLFFADGDVNGGGMYCVRLARALPADYPFHVLSSAALSARGLASVEAMADECEQWLARTRPEGPIVLGGYCHGALVALELARRLPPGRVARLLLVHPSPVEPRLRVVERAVRTVCRLRGLDDRGRVDAMVRVVMGLQFVREATFRQQAEWVRRRLRRLGGTQLPGVLADDRGGAAAGASMRHDDLMWEHVLRLAIAYVPRWYDGDVTIFGSLPHATARTRGWVETTRRCEFVAIPGTHETCVTAHLSELADAVGRALDGV